MKTPFAKLMRVYGTQQAAGDAVGISRQAVNNWRRSGVIPAEHVPALVRKSRGKLTYYDLRPDLYDPEPVRPVGVAAA